MKKLFSLALAVMLLCTMALPVSATGGSTTLTLDYETNLVPSYTLSIPASTTITNHDGFNNIGMVGITESKDMYGYHIDVSCTISPFKGKNTGAEIMAFLSYQVGEALLGESNSANGIPTVFSFYDVQEDGTVANIARNVEGNLVDCLQVGVYMDGNKAPSDTYTSVVTFTSDLVVNG